MSLSIKELIVVAFIGTVVFTLARPILLNFGTAEDFSRRRLVWYLITIAAFIAPNFWLFSAAVILTLVTVGRRDSNPAALFLMLLYLVPSVPVRIPMIGISFLFALDYPLMLKFFILAPAAIRLRRVSVAASPPGRRTMDILLLIYCLLTAVLYLHPEVSPGVISSATPADCLRRAFVGFFRLFIPYYVISRSLNDRRKILEALAYYLLAGCLVSAIALFEATRHWLLYSNILARWAAGAMIPYLGRDGSLRAAASTGHPLALGSLLAVLLGLWMSVRPVVSSRVARIATTLLLLGGLIAAYSRGPWLGAAATYVVFVTLRGETFRRPLRVAAVPLLLAVIVMLTPLGDKVRSVFPFLGGKVGDQTITYRERLFDRSWQIIRKHPVFGDQQALLKMQDLRQGEGIIDLMNGYVTLLLGDGFVGLLLYMWFLSCGVLKSWSAYRRLSVSDPRFSLVGPALISSIVCSLLMMAGGGLNEDMVFCLAALALGYSSAASRVQTEEATGQVIADNRVLGIN